MKQQTAGRGGEAQKPTKQQPREEEESILDEDEDTLDEDDDELDDEDDDEE